MSRRRSSFVRCLALGIAFGLLGCGEPSSKEELSETSAALVIKVPLPGGTNPPVLDPSPIDPGPIVAPPPPPEPFAEIMARFASFDINGDGIAEIDWLRSPLVNPEPYAEQPAGVAVVFVDSRLLTDDSNISTSRTEMLFWLGQLANDLFKEGYFPWLVEAKVYAGAIHQDGRTLLAMRRFLQQVSWSYPLVSTLLVGSFPDAAIARGTFVKAEALAANPQNLTSGSLPQAYVGHYMALDTELITTRGDIVLGDLDGNWEALYRQEEFSITNYHMAPRLPSPSYPSVGPILSATYLATPQSFRDVFLIEDHRVSAREVNGRLIFVVRGLDEPSPEATEADRKQPNRIARPELTVGRLNPLSVAVMPKAPVDLDGNLPLDAAGVPQKLRYAYPTAVTWERSPSFERRLLADYLARSHRFRLGYERGLPFRTSAIRAAESRLASPVGFNNILRQAADGFAPSLAVDDATAIDFALWLREPAVLRGIAAHSNGILSQFGPVTNTVELEFATGGLSLLTGSHVWRWVGKYEGSQWVVRPSFEGMTDRVSFVVYRTMWESKILDGRGQSFFVHDGCEVSRPVNGEMVPYNSPSYGQLNGGGEVQNGESLLFYANGLGLMARNKVFNDTPAGFAPAIKKSGRFGAGWAAYFAADAADARLNERAVNPTLVGGIDYRWASLQRKRSYYWSLSGDPTLKIQY